jgi:hypothetical protein
MRALGMEPMTAGSDVQRTALEVGAGEMRASASVQSWIRRLESALWDTFRIAGTWIGQTLPEDFAFNVFSDFVVAERTAQDIQALISLHQAGVLSKRTLLDEAKRRGLLAEGVDIDAEMDTAEAEAPAFLPSLFPARNGMPAA